MSEQSSFKKHAAEHPTGQSSKHPTGQSSRQPSGQSSKQPVMQRPKRSVARRKKKQTDGLSRALRIAIYTLSGLFVVFVLTASLLWYNGLLPEREQLPRLKQRISAFFSHFGTSRLPEGDVIGIDVSVYQRQIDFDKLAFHHDNSRKLYTEAKRYTTRREVDFVIAKATEGSSHKDKYYNYNRLKAHEKGIPFGAYHFFSAGSSAVGQANNFIRVANLQKGDLAPVLDVEPYKNQFPAVDSVVSWLRQVEKYYAVAPIVYTNQYCYDKYFASDKRFSRYHFWIARYGGQEPSHTHLFWQAMDNGKMAGIKGAVDINVFRGSKEELSLYTIR